MLIRIFQISSRKNCHRNKTDIGWCVMLLRRNRTHGFSIFLECRYRCITKWGDWFSNSNELVYRACIGYSVLQPEVKRSIYSIKKKIVKTSLTSLLKIWLAWFLSPLLNIKSYSLLPIPLQSIQLQLQILLRDNMASNRNNQFWKLSDLKYFLFSLKNYNC